jgi:SET domain-containing protein
MCIGEECIEIRNSKFGKGLFATQNIPAGTLICSITGPHLSFKETLLLGEKESHCIQIGINEYILCEPPFLYSNHSCNPNCGINASFQLFALKNINPGEELFWDYSTSMLERHWTMNCFCGSENCRKLITDFDFLPSELQETYLRMNIVLPFIIDELRFKIAI